MSISRMVLVVAGFILALGTVAFNPVSASPTASWVVVNTNNSGAGSLRQAILDGNAAGGGLIQFNIPGGGPHRIQPATNLPELMGGLTVDGYSQPGASPNTSTTGSNAIIRIELDGILIPSGGTALDLRGSSNVVQGLALGNFTGGALLVHGTGSHRVEGNFIGTDPTGTAARANSSNIVIVGLSSNNWIGGDSLAARNIISGSSNHGVTIVGTKNRVVNNLIGTDATGTASIRNTHGILIFGRKNVVQSNLIAGNAVHGILLTGTGARGNKILGNQIGNLFGPTNGAHGVVLQEGARKNRIGRLNSGINLVTGNLGKGIVVTGAGTTANTFSGNWISGHALGIDLNDDGVTLNDPGDADFGANASQNFPRLNWANSATRQIRGSILTTPNTLVTAEFFVSVACHASNHGEGAFSLGSLQVTTNGAGRANYTFTSPIAFSSGELVTATATVRKNTSEFSRCVTAG